MAGAIANIEGNQIVIRLDIDALPVAVEGGISLGVIREGAKVVDVQAFAKDVVDALNHDDEQGTTLVHLMFDQAFEDAFDDGAQGVEYDDFSDDTNTQETDIEMIDGQPDWEEDDDLPW